MSTRTMTRDIVLCALNAKWEHASFGLRCLQANLGPLEGRSVIIERTIHDRAVDIVEEILSYAPRIVGLGVYVWNAPLMLEVVRALRRVAPDVTVVLGGPEVSHEVDRQEICARAHYVITGEGEDAFFALCERLLAPRAAKLPIVEDTGKVIAGGTPDLTRLPSPYRLYSDEDLRHRIVYVEASRGCPFSCEFCLSALDDGVRVFPQDAFLAELDRLLERGLLRFKFLDRTFNLKIEDAARILAFFVERLRPGLFLHFEMVPDRLPERLRELLAKFPPQVVQLEVGIQTFDDTAAKNVSRRQDLARVEDNLRFLRAHTGVHVHADLIAGLPGEDLASFGRGFDRLYGLGAHEIQVGLLKRLRGAPLSRHDERMTYSESAPYEVLATDVLPFADVQRLRRFARTVDLVVNSGRFSRTVALLVDDAPFAHLVALSEWLWRTTRATHGIALDRLARLVEQHLVDVRGLDAERVRAALSADLGRDRTAHLPKRQSHHAPPRTEEKQTP